MNANYLFLMTIKTMQDGASCKKAIAICVPVHPVNATNSNNKMLLFLFLSFFSVFVLFHFYFQHRKCALYAVAVQSKTNEKEHEPVLVAIALNKLLLFYFILDSGCFFFFSSSYIVITLHSSSLRTTQMHV